MMGSGSSSHKPTPNKAPDTLEPTQRGPKNTQPPRRHSQQFQEVLLEDPSETKTSQCSDEVGATITAPPSGPQASHHLAIRPQVASHARPSPPGYHSCDNAADQEQNTTCGNQVPQTGQQMLNQFKTHKQSKLEAQPGQNPDVFLSMALQLQEMGDEDIVFCTYVHPNGTQYTCIHQGGQCLYLDSWDTQEWRPFPSSWSTQGYFVQDGEPLVNTNYCRGDGATSVRDGDGGGPTFSTGNIDAPPGLGGILDDRAGTLEHPTRGNMLTYVFEEKRNIHCYFDEESGIWVKMPVSWEQHTTFVKLLVVQILKTIPTWTDKYDIIAALRQSNYDIDDTITTYFTVGDTGVMDSSDRLPSFNKKMMQEKDEEIAMYQDKCSKLIEMYEIVAAKNKKLHTHNTKMKRELDQMREQVCGLEVDLKTANMKVVSLHQDKCNRQLSTSPEIETAESDPEPESLNFELNGPLTNSPKVPIPLSVLQGPTVDEEVLRKVDTSTKELDKCQLTLKKEVQDGFQDLSHLAQQALEGLSEMKTMASSTSRELDDLRMLYKKECLQRKLLYNKLQELCGNIHVFCRVRHDARVKCALNFLSDQVVTVTNTAGKKLSYSYDKVFTPQSTQTEVFKEALPIITSCADGYNVCIMAYGQTGAGKTYTMIGTKEDPGVNVWAIQELLQICSEREQIAYTLKVSMMEVYNEHLRDLLIDSETKQNLDIKMKAKKLFIKGLTKIEVSNKDDITRVMEAGDSNRTTAATKMHSSSSRSHLLLMLFVEGINKVSNATSYGSLTLVDLAGSERIAKSGATGQTLVEAAAINKSLTALGQVFTGLRTNALHVPYRNSKLTHLLQPSLGGEAKACLFVNVSPDVNNLQETISTLTFGAGAKQVALGQATKNTTK